MKHFYDNVDGFMIQSNKDFFKLMINNLNGETCDWVEVGSYQGKSAAFCYVELKNKFNNLNFTCVDTFEGTPEENFMKHNPNIIRDNRLWNLFNSNMQPIINDINVIRSLSWEAAEQFADKSIDFCYIDADHSYNSVIKDITAWYPKIKPGGYIGGDDMTKKFPGVAKAVTEFFGKKLKVGKYKRCWFVQKPK